VEAVEELTTAQVAVVVLEDTEPPLELQVEELLPNHQSQFQKEPVIQSPLVVAVQTLFLQMVLMETLLSLQQ
jgi:hypothetical protein